MRTMFALSSLLSSGLRLVQNYQYTVLIFKVLNFYFLQTSPSKCLEFIILLSKCICSRRQCYRYSAKAPGKSESLMLEKSTGLQSSILSFHQHNDADIQNFRYNFQTKLHQLDVIKEIRIRRLTKYKNNLLYRCWRTF